MTITALSDKLCEARQLSHALILAIGGKVEEATAEDQAIERLAAELRGRLEEAEVKLEALRS